MYAKDENKNTREEFWNEFKAWSGGKRVKSGKPGKWIMNDTGIKQLKLKFHFDDKIALAGIEVDTRNLDKRIDLWDKLEKTRKLLEEKVGGTLIWDIEYPLELKKTVSRVYCQIENVNIYDRISWKKVKEFFFSKMTGFEDFFLEYKDYFKYGN
jgi:hypothetical protein